MSELRDQHKAFAEWFLQQNTVAPNAEDLAWAAWKAALAQPETAEPVAWQTFDGEGGYDYRDFYQNEDYELEWKRLNPAYADWVTPLYAHPPRDEWRPASERPTGAHDVEINVIVTGHYDDIAGCWRDTECALIEQGRVIGWRDVQPPTEVGR